MLAVISRIILLAALLVPSVAICVENTWGTSDPSGGLLGVGTLAEMQASNPTGTAVLWQQTNDDGTGDCASSGGSTYLLCQYNGSSWVPAGVSSGIASVVADTTPELGGNLDALGYTVTNIGSIEVDNQPIFYAEDYDGDGINEFQDLLDALSACDAYAEANKKKGTVVLHRGKLQLVVSASYTSPLIPFPTFTNAGGAEMGSCDAVGWGSLKDYSAGGSGDPVGTSFVFWYPDNMVDADGRNVIMQITGNNQLLSGFNIVTTGDADTDTDDTTLLFAASEDNDGVGSDVLGDDPIAGVRIDNVYLHSARTGTGTAFESIFFLNNQVKDSTFRGGQYGWRLTGQTGTANNANLVTGNHFTANDVGIYVPDNLSCQDFYLNGGNTIENNVIGLHLDTNSTCRFYSFGTHWEQDYSQGVGGTHDVLIDSVYSNFNSIGDFYSSLFSDAADGIVRTAVQDSGFTTPADRIIAPNFRDNSVVNYTYAAGAKLILDYDFSLANFEIPQLTDCSGVTAEGWVCWDTDDNVLYIGDGSTATAITGGGGGGNVSDNTSEAITGVWEIQDNTLFNFGNDADWGIQYDETTDDQLLIQSAKTATASTGDALVEVLVDTGIAGMTANQQVFGVAKGSQASNTELFTVDEDGDGVFAGSVTGTTISSGTSSTPGSNFYDVDMGGTPDVNASITANCPTGTTAGGNEDCDLSFSTQVAGTLTEAFRIDTTDAGVQSIQISSDISLPSGVIDGSNQSFKTIETIVLESPADADNFLLFKAPYALTITDIDCVVDPADSSESVVIIIQERDSDGDNPAGVDGVTTITCANTNTSDDGSLSNGGIDAGDWVSIDIGTVTGGVTQLGVTLQYTH